MTLIKDLIAIPERVHQGDFVLKLSEGISQAEQTLRDYEVTEQLAKAFGEALGFIRDAVQSRSSKATYLHGSFGSGKSHFMAVLNLLLSGNLRARAIPELAPVVSGMGWAEGKRFLLVPYHMTDARDMESAILGQYAAHVRRLHPQAPVPGFYKAEMLFRDADELRRTLGDAAFFAGLGEGPADGGGGGWGALESGWDAPRYEAAKAQPPHGEERSRLVGDLIRTHFRSYREIAAVGESYVSLDDGLSIMSSHAQQLGYDAIILFLDELVLWLASRAHDTEFVTREGTKLVKLVESQNHARPIPLVSFVARQRDLRELVGENLSGAQGVQFSDVLKYWEARFHRITLEDRNLPAIARRRVLRPVDEAARRTLEASFDEMNLRREVFETLMTTQADRDMFRKVYPFSPALVQTLIAVSAALQRERTALKLMVQLLVDRRNDLELGQLIPVGDLWEAIADGDEPFSDAMRVRFDDAKKLWRGRLLPMLEQSYGITWDAVRAGDFSTAAKSLRADARLLTTLLLAALVPEVESLKALTPARLAALNHGTFRSPIPGQEAQQVLRKLRDWSAQVGEIKLSTTDVNPVISIQITGVDLEPVLKAAEANDNPGNQRKIIRELLFKRLGVANADDLFLTHDFEWRGTRRSVDIVYDNVHEMTDERLRGRGDGWTVVIDFPFDQAPRTPNDDLARLARYAGGPTRTLIWLPSFLSQKVMKDLGRFVILDYILQGERFDSYAGHLSVIDRQQAKNLAKNLRDSLGVGLGQALEVAYGIAQEPRLALDHVLAPDQQFRSLDPTFVPRPPVGADFASAFKDLLGQLMAYRYPAHPEFDELIKVAPLRQYWGEIRAAIEAPGRRYLVADSALRRKLRGIVNPLRLGSMGETHLLIEDYWRSHFNQCHAREAGAPMTVTRLREWIDQPNAMGLPAEVQNLLILSFAAMTDRRFVLDGKPYQPEIDRIDDFAVLVEQPLPDQADWELAVERASELFGLTPLASRTANSVGKLVADLREQVRISKASVDDYRSKLNSGSASSMAGGEGDRHRTADSAAALMGALAGASDDQLVASLARQPLQTSAAAVARAIRQAQSLVMTLANIEWSLFDAIGAVADGRKPRATAILEGLGNALRNDEHVLALHVGFERARREAVALLAETVAPSPGTPSPFLSPTHPPLPMAPPGVTLVDERPQRVLAAREASVELASLRDKLEADQDLELILQWRLQRKPKSELQP